MPHNIRPQRAHPDWESNQEDVPQVARPLPESLVELEAAMRAGERSESKAEFDRYAQGYASLLQDPVRDLFAGGLFFHRRKWELLEAELRRRGMETQSSDWLDVGCGKGELLSLGRDSFRRAAGCDPSAEMIRDAAGVALQSNPLELPFSDSSFDLVTAVCVYHHVPLDDRRSLSVEIFRVLRPGGTACFMEHNPINPVTKWIVSRTPVDADANLISHWKMRSLVRAVGFRRPESQFFLYFPERIYAFAPFIESFLRGLPMGGQYALFCKRPDIRQAERRALRVSGFVLA